MDEKQRESLLNSIFEKFHKNLDEDKDIKDLLEKMERGIATYEDAYEYAECVAAALSKAFDKSITASMFELEQLDFSTLKTIMLPTYKDAFERVNAACKDIQRALNSGAGIGLKPSDIGYRSRRVVGIAKNASKRETFDELRYAVEGPYLENFTNSIVDDNIKANVELHGKSGLRPKVNRLLNGKGCEFCRTWAGEWQYPGVPKEVFQRHENCRCTVVYDPGDGRKQDVWSKKYYDDFTTHEIQRRIELAKQEQPITNVTTQYLRSAMPGVGKVIEPKVLNDREKDIALGEWIVRTLGKDVTIRDVVNEDYVKNPDAFWRDGLIEFKNPTTRNAIDKRLKDAYEQLSGENCRVLLDIGNNSLEREEALSVIKDKALKRAKMDSDIIVKDGEELVAVFRIKK